MVGTFGRAAERWAEVTAMARSLPSLIKGAAVLKVSNMTWTWPAITSLVASELPL